MGYEYPCPYCATRITVEWENGHRVAREVATGQEHTWLRCIEIWKRGLPPRRVVTDVDGQPLVLYGDPLTVEHGGRIIWRNPKYWPPKHDE